MCMPTPADISLNFIYSIKELVLMNVMDSVQVNIPAESGEMGVLANHVPSIEQLKPGLVEIIEEAGGSKQFFRMSKTDAIVSKSPKR